MRAQRTADILAIVIDNRKLRAQLAEVQDNCIELAVDWASYTPTSRPCRAASPGSNASGTPGGRRLNAAGGRAEIIERLSDCEVGLHPFAHGAISTSRELA